MTDPMQDPAAPDGFLSGDVTAEALVQANRIILDRVLGWRDLASIAEGAGLELSPAAWARQGAWWAEGGPRPGPGRRLLLISYSILVVILD